MPRLFHVMLVAISLTASWAPTPTFADIQLVEKGHVMYLFSHSLEQGDGRTFANFLNAQDSDVPRMIYLNSLGGSQDDAVMIGRLIRSHHLSTAFHVGQSLCVSACTTIFLSGVQRYYIGGADVQDGVAIRRGLGFHPSDGGREGEENAIEYYKEMGTEGASRFRYALFTQEAASNRIGNGKYVIFCAGGRSALDAGVATSLDEPEDLSLRD